MDLQGKTYLVTGNEDIHTKDGVLKKEDLVKNKVITTHLGKNFL